MTTLDTSGVVRIPTGRPGINNHHLWSDLSPFAQGYVEAALAWSTNGAFAMVPHGDEMSSVRAAGFSDLAPEALAMILRDCEAMQGAGLAGTAGVGRSAWSARQAGLCTPEFPPLRVYLNDAGKVMLV